MSELLKVTIEEWAGDNSITVTEKQVEELVDAIDICSEYDSGSRGFTLGHRPESGEAKKIKELESKLHTLECFISSKGFCIDYDIGRVTEHTMVQITDCHRALDRKTTYY